MKKVLIASLVLFSCSQLKQGAGSPEGIYVSYHEQEYGKTHDTLIISKSNGGINMFNITRNASVIRTADGRIFPKRYIHETSTAIYDEDHQVLNEVREGKVYLWNPQKQLILWGDMEFHKK